MAEPLVALSFLQPWLWCIELGHKTVENRTWKPPAKMVGKRFALHASAGYDREAEPFVQGVLAALDVVMLNQPVRSAIVGTARLVGALPVKVTGETRLSAAVEVDGILPGCRLGDLDLGQQFRILASPWTFGPWAWLLADVRRLREPVPCKGALGFWKVPDEIAARVRDSERP